METRNREFSLGIEGRALFLNIKKTPHLKGQHKALQKVVWEDIWQVPLCLLSHHLFKRAVVQRYGWESGRVGTGFVARDACIDF